MDCGVQVDAGKPLIIAEDHRKNPDKQPQGKPDGQHKDFNFRTWRWRASKSQQPWPR